MENSNYEQKSEGGPSGIDGAGITNQGYEGHQPPSYTEATYTGITPTQPVQQQPIIIIQQVSSGNSDCCCRGKANNYASKCSLFIGVLFVFLSAVYLGITIALLAIGAHYMPTGFQTSILLFFSGCFALGAISKERCLIVTFLVLSIITGFLALGQLILVPIDIKLLSDGDWDKEREDWDYNNDEKTTGIVLASIILAATLMIIVFSFGVCYITLKVCYCSGSQRSEGRVIMHGGQVSPTGAQVFSPSTQIVPTGTQISAAGIQVPPTSIHAPKGGTQP